MKPTVGFIGLGLMGAPMAARLLNAGYSLRIHNRTKGKALRFVERGAIWCDNPGSVARESSVVFTIVTNDEALTEITLGKDGIAANLPQGGIHVDCSTVSPDLTAGLEQRYALQRECFIHMPVLGGTAQAAEGTLLLFAGGDPDRIPEIEEFFPVFGKKVWRFPTARHATSTKIVCNSFISGLLISLAQGMVYAAKSGIGARTLLEILNNSALNSPSLQRKGKAMVDRQFAPSFFVENLLKDTNLMIESSKTLGLPSIAADAARQLLEEAVRMGFGKEDYSAAIKVLERAAGIEAH